MRRLGWSGLILLLSACATISTQQEVQLGEQQSAEVNKQLPIIQDDEVNRYVNALGDSIAELSDNRNLQWHFFVVNTKDVNAFALPGGYIYVNRGLIEQADKMDELAGVLGDEIGHVIHRHSVKLIEKQQGASLGLAVGCILTNVCNDPTTGAAINVAGNAVFSKFSRQDEQQADESAVTYVTRAGIDPQGLPSMFQTLLQEQQSNPSTVETWFATHPTEQSRIADTQKLIDQLDPSLLKGLTQDTQAFHDFQNRVKGLPRS